MATFNTAERKSLAKTGAAEPDGSYPIRNGSDLSNAIQAYGRSSNPAKTKAHIISRARALGHVVEDPHVMDGVRRQEVSWNQSGITGSGREPVNQAKPAEPDYLAAARPKTTAATEQPSSVADALSRNHQDNAGMSGGALQ